jgi:hypothetical protein
MLHGRADAVCPAVGDADDPLRVGYGQTLDGALRVRWNRKRKVLFPTPVVPGGCFAVSRRAFEDAGGFDGGLTGWGFEDVEFSLRLWLFGYKCCVQPAAKVLHVFRRFFPYEVKKEAVYANMLRMAYCHFSKERIEACKTLIEEAIAEELEAANVKLNENVSVTMNQDVHANKLEDEIEAAYRNRSETGNAQTDAISDTMACQSMSSNEIEAAVLAGGALERRDSFALRRKYDDDWFMKKFGIPF